MGYFNIRKNEIKDTFLELHFSFLNPYAAFDLKFSKKGQKRHQYLFLPPKIFAYSFMYCITILPIMNPDPDMEAKLKSNKRRI